MEGGRHRWLTSHRKGAQAEPRCRQHTCHLCRGVPEQRVQGPVRWLGATVSQQSCSHARVEKGVIKGTFDGGRFVMLPTHQPKYAGLRSEEHTSELQSRENL